MINFDDVIKENIKKKHNPNCPEIPEYPCRVLIVVGSGSEKINASLNLINHEHDIDKKKIIC